jgi:hypothetical protein
MINGFLVEITNHSTSAQAVALFRDGGLPEGVTLTTLNKKYDYKALLDMAVSERFMGSGFQTDEKGIREIVLCRGNERTHLPLKIILTDEEMVIDGGENYLRIIVPAEKVVLFQLLPMFIKT